MSVKIGIGDEVEGEHGGRGEGSIPEETAG